MNGGNLRALVAALIVVVFAFESLDGARQDSQTSDESVTVASGYSYLKTGRVLINAEHPMLAKAWIGLPLLVLGPELDVSTESWRAHRQWLAAYEFLWENRIHGRRILWWSRLPVIFCSLLLLAAVWLAARRLYGRSAALLALMLTGFAPEFLGHGHLATLDVPLTLATAVVLAATVYYLERPSRRRQLLWGLALGLMLATKVSALQVLPPLFVAALAWALADPALAGRGRIAVPRRLGGSRAASVYVAIGGLTTAFAIGVVVLAATYGFRPWPYLAGVFGNAELAGAGHASFLLGEVSTTGFSSYYLVALATKLPLLTLFVAVLAGLTWPWIRGRRPVAELFLLVFAMGFLLLASRAPVQTGLRYAMPALPPLLVLAARIAEAGTARRHGMILGTALFGGYLGTLAAARPSYLGYFNEIIGGPRGGLGVLADSNLDWGQDLGRLGVWLAEQGSPPCRLSYFGNAPPEAYGISYQALPASGPVLDPPATLLGSDSPDLAAISANNLIGLFLPGDPYQFLRAREPLAVIGSSIWVFALEPGDHARLARVYADLGWSRWAAHERRLAR